MDFRLARGLLDLLIGRALLAEPDVLADRHVEEHVLLEYDRHALAQRLPRDLSDIDAVDGHASFIWHIEPQDQIEQRALAGSARTDNGDALADVELEAEIVKNRRLAAFILEGDVIEGDVVGDARQIGRAGPIGAAGRLVQQFLACGAPPPPTGSTPG